MNLIRFLGDNEKRIKELEEYFQDEAKKALMAYNCFSEHALGHVSKDDLKYLKKKRGEIVSNFCNKVMEYRMLTGQDDIPNFAERFLESSGKLVNLINAELV